MSTLPPNETSTSGTPKGWESTDLETSAPDLKKLYQGIFKYPNDVLGDNPRPYQVMKWLVQMIGLVCQKAGDGFACVLSVAETVQSGDLNAFIQLDGKVINQAVLVRTLQERLERLEEQYEVE